MLNLSIFFKRKSTIDEIAELDRPTLRGINESDFWFSSLGLAWDVITPGSESKISGKKKSQEFLHRIVDVVWARIREQLQTLNKEATICAFLRNVEAVRLDRLWWRRTSRALLTVYQDQNDVMRAAREAEGRFSRTGLCSRVAIEMANCECKATDGAMPGESTLDSLLADIQVLIGAAFDSDAIHSAVVEPELGIARNGEFQLQGNFLEDVVQPYQAGHFSEQFGKAADQYDRLFDKRSVGGRPVEELFSRDFLTAFTAEYGFPLSLLIDVERMLVDESSKQKKIITRVKADQFIQLLSRAGLRENQNSAFLEAFTLIPRTRWDETPMGFHNHDWEPWRFRRRLSVLSRPIIKLANDPSAQFVYGVGLLHQAFSSIVDGAYTGVFDPDFFSSDSMKAWIGRVNNKAGHEFNRAIADVFREEGFQALDSVKASELGGTMELGDFDVLAWCSTKQIIYAAECKKLRSALTIGEICDQLVRFRGAHRDDLYKHLQRVQWLQANSQRLAQFLKLSPHIFEIRSLLVTNTTIPVAFQKNLPMRQNQIVTIRELRSVIRAHQC